MIQNTLSRALRFHRHLHGVSINDAAKEALISGNLIYQWENGALPTTERGRYTLNDYCNTIFGVPVSDLEARLKESEIISSYQELANIPRMLKLWRVRCGLSQAEAAKTAGVSRKTIQRMEAGQAAVPLDVGLSLMRLYEVKIDIKGAK